MPNEDQNKRRNPQEGLSLCPNCGQEQELQQIVGKEAEATLQELLANIDRHLEVSLEAAQAKAPEDQKERDRLVQSGMEYWKAQAEFYKHFPTFALLTAAAFGTLATATSDFQWSIPHFDDFVNTVVLGFVYDLLRSLGLPPGTYDPRSTVIFVGFVFFPLSVIAASVASRAARENILKMKDVENPVQLEDLKKQNIRRLFWGASIFCYVVGLLAFLTLILGAYPLRPLP